MKWVSFLIAASAVASPAIAQANAQIQIQTFEVATGAEGPNLLRINAGTAVIETLDGRIEEALALFYLFQNPEASPQLEADLALKQELEEEQAQKAAFNKTFDKTTKKLASTVGKTRYVYSGMSPSGWDCSGLAMWFYAQFDIELEHSASAQAASDQGVSVKEPQVGDLVAFRYNNSDRAYHVGIYVGDGDMIHSPSPGKLTTKENIKQFASNKSSVSYVRFFNN
jgi:cell wall-associated NlpC family hydrolase